jgi:hypothetical protein
MDTANTDAFGGIEGDRPTLVTPRAYDLRYRSYETAKMFGRAQKLILMFTIAEPGDDFDKPLPRYFNITRLIGKPQKNGAFKVGFNSDFLREYAKLFGVPTRLDRIPMSNFDGCFVRAKVRTVATGNAQQEIPKALQYSVVSEIMELKR